MAQRDEMPRANTIIAGKRTAKKITVDSGRRRKIR
jgi:hypothetical protein